MDQERALKFVFLHIISRWPISDFWAKGRRVYCSTNRIWLCRYICALHYDIAQSYGKSGLQCGHSEVTVYTSISGQFELQSWKDAILHIVSVFFWLLLSSLLLPKPVDWILLFPVSLFTVNSELQTGHKSNTHEINQYLLQQDKGDLALMITYICTLAVLTLSPRQN